MRGAGWIERSDFLSACAIGAIPSIERRSARSTTPRDRHGEHSPLVHFHFHLLESGGAHQFVHLRRGAPAHDPRLAFAIAQNARDEFHLRMPRLVGVNEITAGLDCIGQPLQRSEDAGISRETIRTTRRRCRSSGAARSPPGKRDRRRRPNATVTFVRPNSAARRRIASTFSGFVIAQERRHRNFRQSSHRLENISSPPAAISTIRTGRPSACVFSITLRNKVSRLFLRSRMPRQPGLSK